MSNKVFIDSSILVEFAKNTKTKILTYLISDNAFSCYINETVISEFYFQFLKLSTGKAPATLKASGVIQNVLTDNPDYLFIHLFKYLESDRSLIKEVPQLMMKYNLLPNYAIILATCKINNITTLASHDADFINPCKVEGIELLREE